MIKQPAVDDWFAGGISRYMDTDYITGCKQSLRVNHLDVVLPNPGIIHINIRGQYIIAQ